MNSGQTKLLMGNEAIGHGLLEAGCQVAAAYPGTPSTEILQSLINLEDQAPHPLHIEWSVNEKIAFEVARFLRSFVRYNDWREVYHCIRLLGPDEWHENVDNDAYTNRVTELALEASGASRCATGPPRQPDVATMPSACSVTTTPSSGTPATSW